MSKTQSNPTPALGNCVLHCPTSCVHAVVPLSGEGVVSTQKLDTAQSSPTPCEGGGWERVETSTFVHKVACSAPPPDKGEAGRGSKPQLHNLKYQENRRRQLRKNPTEPEKRFWSWVRGKQLGTKFRRQHGIGQYIVDFYCAEFGLIIEIDGDSHYTEDAKEYDNERTAFLQSKGYQVVRFTNLEVMQNKEGVLTKLMVYLGGDNAC